MKSLIHHRQKDAERGAMGPRVRLVFLGNLSPEKIIFENNEVCKEDYKIISMSASLKEHIDAKIDVIENHPNFHYEIPAYETKLGVTYVISLYGKEFFNWAESENEKS